MHILFTRFPFQSHFGGAEKQVVRVMQGLQDKGHDVEFMGSCEPLLGKCKELGVKNVEVRIGLPPVSKFSALSFLWRKRMMKKQLMDMLDEYEIRNTKYEIRIFMVSLSEKILLTPYAVQKGIKVVWIEHDSVGRWLSWNPWLSTLKRLSKVVTTVCVSELSADIFRGLGYENVVAIPNGVDQVESGERKVESETLRVGCIARLDHEKGVDVLVDAVRDLSDVELKILGDGPQKSVIEKRLQPTTNNQQLLTSIDDINDFYSQIDLLVLPSRSNDPFGLTVAEAMTRGIATVCTDQCGIARHITPGIESMVCQAGSAAALREAIAMMCDDARRKSIAEAGRAAAQREFSVEKMVGRYEKVASC